MNKKENKHRLRDEYIKHKKEQFAKGLERAFVGNNLYVIIFTDNQQSMSFNGTYADLNNCLSFTNKYDTRISLLKKLFANELTYYGKSIDKWISYKCNHFLPDGSVCNCNTFYIWGNYFVCSNCFAEHLVSDYTATFKNKEDSLNCEYRSRDDNEFNYDTPMIKWHRFGLISKYEFDKFMKDCTNLEQVVYW